MCSESLSGSSLTKGQLSTTPGLIPTTPPGTKKVIGAALAAAIPPTLPRLSGFSGQALKTKPSSISVPTATLAVLPGSPTHLQQQPQPSPVPQQQPQPQQRQQPIPPGSNNPMQRGTRQVTAPGSTQDKSPLNNPTTASSAKAPVLRQSTSGAVRLAQEAALDQITSSLGPANPAAHKQALQVQMLSDHTFLMEGKYNTSEMQLRNAISLIEELRGRMVALEKTCADDTHSKGLESRIIAIEQTTSEASKKERRLDAIVAENLEIRMLAVEKASTAAERSRSEVLDDRTAAASLEKRITAMQQAVTASTQQADVQASLHAAAQADSHTRMCVLETSLAAAAAAVVPPSVDLPTAQPPTDTDIIKPEGSTREMRQKVAILEAAVQQLNRAVQSCSSSSETAALTQEVQALSQRWTPPVAVLTSERRSPTAPTVPLSRKMTPSGIVPALRELGAPKRPSQDGGHDTAVDLSVLASALMAVQAQVQELDSVVHRNSGDVRQQPGLQHQHSGLERGGKAVDVEAQVEAQMVGLREWVQHEMQAAEERMEQAVAIASRRDKADQRRPMSSHGGAGGAASSAMLAAIEEQLLNNSDRMEFNEGALKGLTGELREARAELASLGAAAAAVRAAAATAAERGSTPQSCMLPAPGTPTIQHVLSSRRGSTTSGSHLEVAHEEQQQQLGSLEANVLNLDNRMFALQIDRKLSEISYAKIIDLKETENHVLERCGRLQDSIESLQESVRVLTVQSSHQGMSHHQVLSHHQGTSQHPVPRGENVRSTPPQVTPTMTAPASRLAISSGRSAPSFTQHMSMPAQQASATAEGLRALDESTASSVLSLREDIQMLDTNMMELDGEVKLANADQVKRMAVQERVLMKLAREIETMQGRLPPADSGQIRRSTSSAIGASTDNTRGQQMEVTF